MIIGITGLSASGKDTVAEILEQHGFANFSLSDIVREHCRAEGKETTRENLFYVGNGLREKFGSDCLARETLQKIKDQNIANATVVSIRHPEELKTLRTHPDFLLLTLETPIEERFARTQRRQGRTEDRDNYEEFVKNEKMMRTGTGPGMQMDAVIAQADLTIENIGTIEELKAKVEDLLINSNL